MSEEWGPWIEHDGRSGPVLTGTARIELRIDGCGEIPQEYSTITPDYPAWFWTWRRVGWFKSKYCRVCDNPAYAPIARYRIRKPKAMTMQEEISRGVREPLDA